MIIVAGAAVLLQLEPDHGALVILTLTASILLYTTGKNSEVKASFTSGLGKKSNALLSAYRDDLDEDK